MRENWQTNQFKASRRWREKKKWFSKRKQNSCWISFLTNRTSLSMCELHCKLDVRLHGAFFWLIHFFSQAFLLDDHRGCPWWKKRAATIHPILLPDFCLFLIHWFVRMCHTSSYRKDGAWRRANVLLKSIETKDQRHYFVNGKLAGGTGATACRTKKKHMVEGVWK